MVEATIPDRVRWAVDQIGLQPDERVLEIGGGPGAAAELICARLESGWLLEVDRSATAIERMRRRHHAHAASGRLRLKHAELRELDLRAGSLDVAFSVNVNLFWTRPADRELGMLFNALVPGGRLLIMYGPAPGGGGHDRVLQAVRDHVAASPFGPPELVDHARGAAVLARRSPR